MGICSACTVKPGSGVSFHGFPKDKVMRKRWCNALPRQRWSPCKSSKLCSAHFTADCFENSGWSSRRQLKRDAVPSIFDVSQGLKGEIKLLPREKSVDATDIVNVRCTPDSVDLTRNVVCDIPPQEVEIVTVDHLKAIEKSPPKRPRMNLGNFKDLESFASSLVVHLNKAKFKVIQKNKQVKLLQKKIRGLENKVNSLQAMVKSLREENLRLKESEEIDVWW